jgi:hypothetical protein
MQIQSGRTVPLKPEKSMVFFKNPPVEWDVNSMEQNK